MPPEGSTLIFKNIRHQQSIPFVIYADFECLTPKIENPPKLNAKSNTVLYQKHRPCSVGLLLVTDVKDLPRFKYEHHTGIGSTQWLLVRLQEIQETCMKYVYLYNFTDDYIIFSIIANYKNT